MRNTIFSILLSAAISGSAFAQDNGTRRGWGYVFAGPGVSTRSDSGATFNVGGGGEALVAGGFGAGGEVSYLTRFNRFSDGIGLASANVSYHFKGNDSSRKVVPFVTGGASLGFRGGENAGGGNFGGGAQYWFSERVGARFEVRTHVFSSDSPFNVGFRVGLSFK
ncbi:MAG TPA: hypothetical protein VE262_15700 [Blastocatellia bacterium]|nr:hypothetical protein [Blastocatellia bacterium]